MKKVILIMVICIAVLTLVLLAFSCDSGVIGETAHAGVDVNSYTGIVNPNLLPFYDFSTASLTSNSSISDFTSSTPVGIYYTSDTSIVSLPSYTDFTNYTSLCTVFDCTSSVLNFYIVFDVQFLGTAYSCFSFSFLNSLDGYSYSGSLVNLNTLSSQAVTFTALRSSNNAGLRGKTCGWDFTDSTSRFLLHISLTGFTSSDTLGFAFVKFEDAKRNTSLRYRFSGFLIPEYSYLSSSSPVPSPYDGWDGIVYPNLLNGSDFYELPYYGVPSMSPTDESFYYTDIPTDAFYFDPNYSQFPYVENAVGFSTLDGINNITPHSKYIKYRYYYKDLMADEIGVAGSRYYLTYTLKAFITGDLVITIEDDLSNVVTESFVPDVNNNIYSVTLPASGAPSLFNYVDITVTFYAPDENSPVSCSLFWSKLEATGIFTGYVPVSHSSPDLSAMNYINNFDFSYLGSSVVGDNYWFYEDGYGLITMQDDLKGWHIEYTSQPDFALSYIFSGLDIPSGTTCTFSLYASTSSLPFDVKIYTYSEGVYTLSKSAHYTKSLTSFVRSVVCTYSDHLKVSLVFPHSGESEYFLLDYAKFEIGDIFTGFLPSNAGLLQQGIDAVTNYNNGVPVVGAFYDFASDFYDDFTLSYGDTSVFDPSFTYYGSLTTSWSSTLGLCIPSDGNGGSLTTSTYHFNENSSASAKYVFAYQFYSVNPVDVNFIFGTSGGSLSYSNINYTRTIDSTNGFVWFALDAPPDSVTITLVTPNTYLYLTKYKMEKSPFFTGFPNDDLDYNSAVVPQYFVGYSSGYAIGFQEGSTSVNNQLYNSGYDSGYTDGYGSGKYVGRSIGYQEGLSLANNGSWRSLVSALIDVPVTTIVSFLDFEILGFNMLNILRTVILLSLFFFLLNKMTGK